MVYTIHGDGLYYAESKRAESADKTMTGKNEYNQSLQDLPHGKPMKNLPQKTCAKLIISLLFLLLSCLNESPVGPEQTITVTSPGNDTTLIAGRYYYIQWVSSAKEFPLVTITLQRDTAMVFAVVNDIANKGAYFCQIPPVLPSDSTYSINITGTGKTTVSGASATFSIRNNGDRYEPDDIAIIATPVSTDSTVQMHTLSCPGDVDWFTFNGTAGQSYLIHTGGAREKSITLYSADGPVQQSSTIPLSSMIWTCQTSGTFCFKVCSRDTGLYSYADTMPYDAYVKSAETLLFLTSPKDGETDTAGTPMTVKWVSSSNVAYVTLHLLLDTTVTLSASHISSTNQSYTLNLPISLPGSPDYRMKIVNDADEGIYSVSDPFSIVAREYSLEVTSPDGSTQWGTGDTVTIKWVCSGLKSDIVSSYLAMDLYDDTSHAQTIASYVSLNDSTLRWIIPWGFPVSSRYRIKLTYRNDSSVCSFSDYFSIAPTPSTIQVISPLSGTGVTNDTTLYIQWKTAGEPITAIDIDLCDSTATICSIFSNMGSSYHYHYWLIPFLIPTGSYRIQITEHGDPAVSGCSGYFSITRVPTSIAIVSPASGETYSGSCRIRWTTIGPAGNKVNIGYWTDTGMIRSMNSGYAFTGNAGLYDCPIPVIFPQGDRYRVKLIAHDDTTIQAFSDFFTINPVPKTITITYPPADTTFLGGKLANVFWTSIGVADGYSSEYSFRIDLCDSFTVVLNLFQQVQYTVIGASWTVPTSLPTKSSYRFKLTSLLFPDVVADGAYFRILNN